MRKKFAALTLLVPSLIFSSYLNCSRTTSSSPPQEATNDREYALSKEEREIQALKEELLLTKVTGKVTAVTSKTTASRAPSSINKAFPTPASPFQQNKNHIELDKIYQAQPTSTSPQVRGRIASAGLAAARNKVAAAPLLATINNECIEARDQAYGTLAAENFLSSRIAHRHMAKRISDLRIQNYSFTVDELPEAAEISQMAEADPCLIGLSNNQLFKSEFVSREPFISSQPQINAMRSLEAYDTFFSKSIGIDSEIVFAVIDSGVDYNHEDLRGRMWKKGNLNYGTDIANGDADPYDDVWHGTFVAGLIAAQGDNQKGILGTMPLHGSIMAIKVATPDPANPTSAQGTLGDIANGIRWAVDNGAHVLNISMAGPFGASELQDAIRYAIDNGRVVVLAAGNDNQFIDAATPSTWLYPAIYAALYDGAISVGNYNVSTNAKSSTSNYGVNTVEISAPGDGGVYSTMKNSQYGEASGTSFSAPIVAGAAGLTLGILRKNGYNPTPSHIESILLLSASKRQNLTTYFLDGNYLDLKNLANLVESLVLSSNGGMRTEF